VSPSKGPGRGRPRRDGPVRGRPDPARPPPGHRQAPRDPPLAVQLGLPLLLFAAAVGIAELAGAANLGVAFGVGQVAFIAALFVLLVRRYR
jgi:hypothetical protein